MSFFYGIDVNVSTFSGLTHKYAIYIKLNGIDNYDFVFVRIEFIHLLV